jgi:iron complex transport system substrate-binding protein
VKLAADPRRIVSLAPSNTEIVCALDACDELVGVTDYDDYPAEVREIPDVVIYAQVDIEKVVNAEPDLVIAAGNEQTPTSVIDRLEELGLTVLVLYPERLDEIYDDITLVGEALDEQEDAASLVSDMEERAAAVEEAVAGASEPRTFYEVGVFQGTIYTAGSDSFLASLIQMAGGDPVTGNAQGVIQPEALVAADPELILLGDAAYEPRVTPQDLRQRGATWVQLTAVREDRIVPMLQDLIITRPGPRIVEGLELLARAIHPEAF